MEENKPKPSKKKPKLPPARPPKISQVVQEGVEASETKQQSEDSRS